MVPYQLDPVVSSMSASIRRSMTVSVSLPTPTLLKAELLSTHLTRLKLV